MKRKRIISIKHPKLREIRNNFRILLIKATDTQWYKLQEEIDQIEIDSNGKLISFRELTIEQKQKINRLEKKKSDLDRLVDISICKCRRCVRTNQDMTYNPVDKAWYCVECYEEMQNLTYNKKTGISDLYP